MQFIRPCILFSCFVSASIALICYLFVFIHPAGEAYYHQLSQESTRQHSRQALEKQPAYQLRTGVQKDIWTLDGTERLHARLRSAHSELVLKQKGKKFEAVEKLQNLQCWIQEQIDPLLKLQKVRHLSAEEGSYHFPSQRFHTQNAHLSFFRLPNTSLPQTIEASPFLHGIAQEMRGDLLHDDLQCKNPSGYFIPDDETDPLCFSSQTLFWEKSSDRITLAGDVSLEQPDKFIVQSDKALLTMQEETTPSLCYFTGHVQFFAPHLEDKPSFALADTLVLYPFSQTLVLASTSPKRVLFWQEGFSLSAPEVHLHKNPITHQESVEGKGDVHFSFDSEEKNLIQELLSKYL